MQPGVFLTSSDDFQTFELEEQLNAGRHLGLGNNDFVLLAHRSSLAIAKDHGVYVLDQDQASGDHSQNNTERFGIFKCKFVLQKPSVEKMRQMDIVLRCQNSENEFVYTDSVFFFSHRVTRDLISFYDAYFEVIRSNAIEVDVYRDFLQPLGSHNLDLAEFLASIKKGKILGWILKENYKQVNG